MSVTLPKRWTGPLDIAFDGLNLNDRKHSLAEFNEENLETEAGDFTKDVWGKKMTVKITMDEVDDTDADTIEDTSSCAITSQSKSKTMTLSGIKEVKANLAGTVTQITIVCVKTDGSRCWSIA
jgi:hypothetical protein